MNYASLERRLQAEISAVIDKNEDVFSAVLGVSNSKGDFYWEGTAGTGWRQSRVARSKRSN